MSSRTFFSSASYPERAAISTFYLWSADVLFRGTGAGVGFLGGVGMMGGVGTMFSSILLIVFMIVSILRKPPQDPRTEDIGHKSGNEEIRTAETVGGFHGFKFG